MAFLETWILVVDDQFKVIGDIFPVTTSDQDNVYALAVGAKEYWARWQQGLTKHHPTKFTVWRLLGKASDIEFEDNHERQQRICEIFSTMQVKQLHQDQKIANLHIPEGDVVIFVMIPSELCIYIVVILFSHMP